jgi:hypothetical protein
LLWAGFIGFISSKISRFLSRLIQIINRVVI